MRRLPLAASLLLLPVLVLLPRPTRAAPVGDAGASAGATAGASAGAAPGSAGTGAPPLPTAPRRPAERLRPAAPATPPATSAGQPTEARLRPVTPPDRNVPAPKGEGDAAAGDAAAGDAAAGDAAAGDAAAGNAAAGHGEGDGERLRPMPAPAEGHPAPGKRCRGWRCKLRVQLGLEGYYSADMTYIKDLANLEGSVLPNSLGIYREKLEHTLYFTHHLRMEPSLSIGKLATLYLRFDGLQHVVWGDNDARAQSPLFAGNPTNTNDFGETTSSFKLRWAWLDLDLKLGKLRVGRMPSQWGMGLLSNGGGELDKHRGGIDDDFADNHHPSIYDRILFATKPLSIIKTLAGAKDPSSHLILAYAYDRLVEEPYWEDINLEAQRAYGESSFLSRQQNNVDEHVLVLAYSNPEFLADVKSLRGWKRKSFTAGVYAVYRRMGSQEGILRYVIDGQTVAFDCTRPDPPPACGADSKVGIIDPYLKLRLGPYLLETESYFIFGKTEPGRGIPIGDNVDKAFIYGWVVRAGYDPMSTLALRLDVGQASGDKVYGNETFRQRPMHPDYAPGLIMYRMFLRERSATALAQRLNSNVAGVPTPARSLQSNGGVLNSYFLYPRARWRLHPLVTLKLAVLAAWSHRPEEFLFKLTGCEEGAKGVGCRIQDNHIGTEVDLGVDIAWGGTPELRHLFFRFDMGYLIFGKQVSGDYEAPGIFALRMRLMFVF